MTLTNIFKRSALLLVLFLLAAFTAFMTNKIAGIAVALILLLGIPGLLWRWIQCFRARLTITNRRAIFSFGIWGVTTTEIMIRDIREVQVRHPQRIAN